MQTRLRLFLDWGITFGEAYQTPEHGQRKVYYADRKELEKAIKEKYPPLELRTVPSPARQTGDQARSQHLNRKAEGDGSALRT